MNDACVAHVSASDMIVSVYVCVNVRAATGDHIKHSDDEAGSQILQRTYTTPAR